ncbi:M2 family metallopeptidase [Parachryseolinea silvisoli]|uniref:M2 family metallopeptidase n=1 Tax=Parachryseolinea silvisoli TaxID=2873601 RepID=UPI002265B6FF|nr:M2 family metallopeptidase [Parachryseolinea silvisoli]MCD9016768.1 M2 family metallopeptidase [Parachryseolinea silvisoli]
MRRYLPLLAIILWGACSNPQQDAQKFIDQYTKTYVERYTASSQAAWKTNIEIKEGDTVNAYNSRVADEALASFTGSVENIGQAQKFLAQKDKLTHLQIRQLEIILYKAGSDPQTVSGVVKEKIRASVAQTEKLFGFAYTLDGKPVSTNDIDNILKTENDEQKRLAAWNASKEVGKVLKPGLVNLRRLRNETVQALKYPDFFSYQVSDYGLSTPDMMELMKRLNQELRPLFRELHTYARYTLAKKYGAKEVPDYLPAHWLPNRWGQDWSAMLDVKGLNVDSVLATKTPQWIVQEGEAFYKSLGFDALPASFWEKSSLYPYPSDSVVKKNNHASAWHVDLNNDLRSLMSIETNAEWFETSNHELGHIYYYQSYTTPEIPPLLREGANRAFHEAIGSMMGMAAMQKPYLVGRGLIAPGAKTDSIQILLKEALNFAVFIPFAAGTMSEFEKALYADNLPESEFNKKWWELTKQYQGIVPPSDREETYCDAATKTHINDDAAQYYDYALSYVILFQLHQHIAEKILHQDARATNYFGNQSTGEFLKKIMASGASKNWRDVLKEATGEDMNATAMVRYFEPLMQWLKTENQGRKYTLPEQL